MISYRPRLWELIPAVPTPPRRWVLPRPFIIYVGSTYYDLVRPAKLLSTPTSSLHIKTQEGPTRLLSPGFWAQTARVERRVVVEVRVDAARSGRVEYRSSGVGGRVGWGNGLGGSGRGLCAPEGV